MCAVPQSDRDDFVVIGVAGSSDGSDGSGAGSAGGSDGRRLLLQPGDTYRDAADALRKSKHPNPYVVDVSARSLELLCEDLGDHAANREFNGIMHTVLGVAEQVRYCDEVENPTYGRGPAAYDEWQNPINCTWGFHRPPALPEASHTCATRREELVERRSREVLHQWENQGNWGMFSNYKGAQVWSTNDRVLDLYRQFI